MPHENRIILIKTCLIMIFLFVSTSLCWSGSSPKITLSHDLINFNFTSGQSGAIEADTSIRVTAKSKASDWSLYYQATSLTGTEVQIMPDKLLIKTPYTNGFESLDMPRFVGKGQNTGSKTVELATMEFRYTATGQEIPGTYEGDIFSLEGGPTIRVRMTIGQEEETKTQEQSINQNQNKQQGPKIKMSVLPDAIHFPATGAPGDYDADNPVLLTVTSKYSFVVSAQATPLYGQDSEIPPARLFVNPGDGNYYSLGNDIVVLERSYQVNPAHERTVTTNLGFRLYTTWDDKGGEYTGEIIFTCSGEK